MAKPLNVWFRIERVLAAFSLMKLAGAAVLFVLVDGSPLFALGIVFAVPVIAAGSVQVVRLLRQAANGRRPDYGFLDQSNRWRAERVPASPWGRDRPTSRSFADTYIDVTPIRYRHVRTSVRTGSHS